jgi:hypothetical protein
VSDLSTCLLLSTFGRVTEHLPVWLNLELLVLEKELHQNLVVVLSLNLHLAGEPAALCKPKTLVETLRAEIVRPYKDNQLLIPILPSECQSAFREFPAMPCPRHSRRTKVPNCPT